MSSFPSDIEQAAILPSAPQGFSTKKRVASGLAAVLGVCMLVVAALSSERAIAAVGSSTGLAGRVLQQSNNGGTTSNSGATSINSKASSKTEIGVYSGAYPLPEGTKIIAERAAQIGTYQWAVLYQDVSTLFLLSISL